MTTALITGANKGIGFETARLLGERGMTVLIGARDEERGRAAADRLGQRYVPLDVTDPASAQAAAKWIEKEYGTLDVLINNAGVTGGPEELTPSGISLEAVRGVYETNVFGVITVTNAMLPLLRTSKAGRIVNMSSELGSLTYASDPESALWAHSYVAYNSSKSALNMITVAYAKELLETPIKVNAANPGYCATDLNGHTGFRTAEQGAAIAVHLASLDANGPTGAFLQDDGALPW
ncbi:MULTISPECIES: SDR family oxidoreductase [Streptosporangium]|uniref:NAD(P)-dependent dehydrogenase (Short-subunit alcohol dehydrogenase family) n=1 Tax=Streptosporangium brasiliense TaxID=47480 RepID=A0ABT9RJJ2_9ACTN|nr:SDR family oxidoreductase [Streptosporangium brasiliense]MDP9868894.1 NAD(P)-dependent dehydrogenase (short-subunit alcohol dehydrogenase family) [Streptosporangium brasiliense]